MQEKGVKKPTSRDTPHPPYSSSQVTEFRTPAVPASKSAETCAPAERPPEQPEALRDIYSVAFGTDYVKKEIGSRSPFPDTQVDFSGTFRYI